jgi:hypothetical protein
MTEPTDIDMGVPAETPGLYRGVLRAEDGTVLLRCTTRFLSVGDTMHPPTMTTSEN